MCLGQGPCDMKRSRNGLVLFFVQGARPLQRGGWGDTHREIKSARPCTESIAYAPSFACKPLTACASGCLMSQLTGWCDATRHRWRFAEGIRAHRSPRRPQDTQEGLARHEGADLMGQLPPAVQEVPRQAEGAARDASPCRPGGLKWLEEGRQQIRRACREDRPQIRSRSRSRT